MIRSRASSRWRAAKVFGESGAGGRLGSSSVPAPAPDCCLVCCCGSGGDVCPCNPAAAPVDAAIDAGIGGEDEFLGIFARAGAALGMLGGGVAGALSW